MEVRKMNLTDEIFAFLVEGHFVCFNCYLPGKDKEDVILTRADLGAPGRLICERCDKRIQPDRRMINRRSGLDRRRQAAKVLAPDRRCGQERRRGADRRSFFPLAHMAEDMDLMAGDRAAIIMVVDP